MISVDVVTGDEHGRMLATILPVYVDVYQEPPYCERLDDVADFAAGWPGRVRARGFRLALARDDGQLVGFSFGHELAENTAWWTDPLGPLDVDTTEWPGRTFAVIELAVVAGHRRRGVASALHEQLLADTDVERVTLAVRPEPEADPARTAYKRWGYRKVGQQRPAEGAPVYDLMVNDHPR